MTNFCLACIVDIDIVNNSCQNDLIHQKPLFYFVYFLRYVN